MVQGEDGYWYAYIASTAAAAVADANTNIELGTAETAGVGPDLCGTTCRTGLTQTLSVSSSATVYTEIADSRDTSAPTLSQVDAIGGTSGLITGVLYAGGQHNASIGAGGWPFIQTWEFADDSDVTIVLEKAGEDESVTLNFESGGTGLEDYAYIELDRSSGPAGAQLHMTIYDNQLNHDPTQEDSVAFLTNGTYGVSYNASVAFAAYSSAEFGDNGALKITLDAAGVGTDVLVPQNNADCVTDTVSGAD